MSYEMLENIAVLRFICIHISKWIIEIFVRNEQSESILDQVIEGEKKNIISVFKDKCQAEEYENVRLFLFKNIYHYIGSDTITKLNSDDCYSWTIPNCVERKTEVLVTTYTTYRLLRYWRIHKKRFDCGNPKYV